MTKKAIFIFIAFFCIGLTSCVDNSYQGYFFEENYTETEMPIPVRIMIGSADDITEIGINSRRADYVQTKGTGVISEASQLNGRDFYVYSFNSDITTDMTVTSKEDENWCLIDGSTDEIDGKGGSLFGKKARISDISNVVEWQVTQDQLFWPYKDKAGQVYNIFAYYIDDAQLTDDDIKRDHDNIKLNIEIDGSQDIMSSRAAMTNEQKALFKDEKDLTDMMHYCYGYYAAQKGINPVLIFKHHLTKLDFTITPGVTEGISNEVTVKSVEIRSRYKAEFTVADKGEPSNVGLSFEDEYKALPLAEEDGSLLISDNYVIRTYPEAVEPSKAERIKLGGSIIVAPDMEYIATITLKEVREDGIEHDNLVTELPINKNSYFEAGNRYNITLTIYGATEVEVSVHLKEWYEGGDIFIDNEPVPEL